MWALLTIVSCNGMSAVIILACRSIFQFFNFSVAHSLGKQLTFRYTTTGFLMKMTSEKRAQKFHSDDVSPPRSG